MDKPADNHHTGDPVATDPDIEESAWDNGRVEAVGAWGYVVLTERNRKLPPKPFGFGFQA